MNKKLNTAVFLIIASIFNIFLALFILIILFLLVSFIAKYVSSSLAGILRIVMFPTAFFAAFLIYYYLLDFIEAKFGISKYINPNLIKKRKDKQENL